MHPSPRIAASSPEPQRVAPNELTPVHHRSSRRLRGEAPEFSPLADCNRASPANTTAGVFKGPRVKHRDDALLEGGQCRHLCSSYARQLFPASSTCLLLSVHGGAREPRRAEREEEEVWIFE
ncbi:hypothetical protein HPB50_010544 [Hyalomma asiaticum]|uniref:Uncharacterized protein n=1 Tax=Hyalomma asiaticum TaxID=266040 RepID=A0ACB7T772_HYAAI|nr:hypothetical protein HPB50_010544 [Hyalomma asiaticum]